ncbi:hypothetical protein PG990_000185 [Apiospora arundinis]
MSHGGPSRKEPKRKIDSSIPQQRAMETELPGEIRAVVEPIKTELKAESAELKATVPEARTTSSRAMRPGPSESVHMPLLEDIDIKQMTMARIANLLESAEIAEELACEQAEKYDDSLKSDAW